MNGGALDLSFLCRLLSPWTGEEELLRLKEAARSGRVRWEQVALLANRSNLAPALRVVLKARRVDAPVELRAYLEEIYRFNGNRNRLLREELLDVAGLLNKAGIVPMPLKGAAALATGVFPDPAVRFMWDLDLFVPPGKIRHAVTTLEEGGYFVPGKYLNGGLSREDFFRKKHFAPLIRDGVMAPVEVHRQVVSDEWNAFLDTEAVWEDASLFGSSLLPGVSLAVMSPTHQIVHCFIHSELDHKNHSGRRLNLRQLHHFAHLCLRLRDRVDWERVAALRGEERAGRALGAYLHLARELFGVETPLSAIPDAYAKRYFIQVLFLSRWRLEWLRIVKDLLGLVMGCLSEQSLIRCYPSDVGPPVQWRRLRRMGVLFGRYSRLEVWKKLIGSMRRRYDSLG